MDCPKCTVEMSLGKLYGVRDQSKWVPAKGQKSANQGAYPDAVMLGRMHAIGGSPVDAFCCPDCYSVFVDGVNCKPSNK